jgi:hypothetical protein
VNVGFINEKLVTMHGVNNVKIPTAVILFTIPFSLSNGSSEKKSSGSRNLLAIDP